MTSRRFELSDGKSDKFWEIARDGSSVTVRFGRIGTSGQVQSKDHGSESAASSEVERLVREKTKKGYAEVGAPAAVAAPEPPRPEPPKTESTKPEPPKPEPTKPGSTKPESTRTKSTKSATTKKVPVGASAFRAPPAIAPSSVATIPQPAFEIAHWPTQEGFAALARLAVADDGAVLLTKSGDPTAHLWQLTPSGMESIALATGSPWTMAAPAFAPDERTALLLSSHVQAFDRSGARLREIRGDAMHDIHQPLGFLRDGRLLAAHYDGDAGKRELTLDLLGEPLSFAGKLEHAIASDLDEDLDRVVTAFSVPLRSTTKCGFQLWSISERKLVSTIELVDFPPGITAVKLMSTPRGVRIVLVSSSCLFVTDPDGAVHHAVQLERASTILALPGGRVAIPGAPPFVFDLAANELVARLELPGWVTKELLVSGLPGTTRAVLSDVRGRVGLVDFATSAQWTPIEGRSAALLSTVAASRSGRYVAGVLVDAPVVLRAPG